ncbi:hypothetical protein PENANT_c067G03147 [Penicillium antarcticum]|uniref:Uncharacterized protein n=1 Tax=Penicillium antarcticum TaxID=416450 RepID=A0A1V6PPN3_9EURO|nr:hypothetical protein PENANT_c067G03147 [Penicillium antarcticum]
MSTGTSRIPLKLFDNAPTRHGRDALALPSLQKPTLPAQEAELITALHPESCNASGKQQKWPLSLSIEINADIRLPLNPSTL